MSEVEKALLSHGLKAEAPQQILGCTAVSGAPP